MDLLGSVWSGWAWRGRADWLGVVAEAGFSFWVWACQSCSGIGSVFQARLLNPGQLSKIWGRARKKEREKVGEKTGLTGYAKLEKGWLLPGLGGGGNLGLLGSQLYLPKSLGTVSRPMMMGIAHGIRVPRQMVLSLQHCSVCAYCWAEGGWELSTPPDQNVLTHSPTPGLV